MATLEAAGYIYNPFTKNDIWGGPTPVALTPLLKQELPVGADDSPLRQMVDPGIMQQAPIHPNSSANIPKVQHPRERQMETESSQKLVYLGLFAAILAAAFWFRVP